MASKYLSLITLQIVQTIPLILNYLPFFFGLLSACLFKFCWWKWQTQSEIHLIYISALVICLSEVLFFGYSWNLNKELNASPLSKRPYLTKEERAKIITMCAESMEDSEHVARGWLSMDQERMAKHEPMNRNHVLDWIGWAVFGKSSVELSSNDIAEAERYANQAGLGKFLSTTAPKKQPTIRMFNQLNVPFQYIPLMAYIFVYFIKSVGSLLFNFLKFQHHKINGINNISYWIRENKYSKEPPIIFCHGVGIGPVTYSMFIYKLAKRYPNRTIIILQLDYLSMGLVEKPATRQEHLKFFDSIFKKHKLPPAHWISHSFGSFLISSVANLRSKLIQDLTFIDPVCFNLLDPYLVNQVYHGPLKSCSFQYILRYLIAYEFSVVRFFLRNFWWEEMVFFPNYLNNIQGNVRVYLSEDDVLVDCNRMTNFFTKYFNKDQFQWNILKSTPHGGCLWNLKLINELSNNIN